MKNHQTLFSRNSKKVWRELEGAMKKPSRSALQDIALRRLAADQGDAACASQFLNAVGPHQLDERLDLLLAAGDLDHQALGGDVDHPAAEHLHQQADLVALRRPGVDLDQHQV